MGENMGYIVKNEPQHSCTTPTQDRAVGDIWQCPTCGQGWKAIASVSDRRRVGYYNKISARRLRRIIARQQRH